MTALPNSQSARLDFRITPEHKLLIERAAGVDGQTVSNYAISTLVKAAAETIQRAAVRTLSKRDSQTFLQMLDADVEPNAALKAAAKRYKRQNGARNGTRNGARRAR